MFFGICSIKICILNHRDLATGSREFFRVVKNDWEKGHEASPSSAEKRAVGVHGICPGDPV